MVLSIIAILFAMAVPNPGDYLDDNRLRAGSSDLVAAMQTARVEAVGRNAAITLCKKNADSSDCTTAGGWQQGWLVFVDANQDSTVDTGDEIIQIHDELFARITLYGTSAVADSIVFRANGQTSVTSTQALILCDERGFGTDAKGLLVSILGRASVMPAPQYRPDNVSGTGVNRCR